MNAEVAKIRRSRNYNEKINREPTRIKPERLDKMCEVLNRHLGEIEGNDTDTYVTALISNVYIILNMFNEMGIYPDYFYDELVKVKVEYRKLMLSDDNVQDNYRSNNNDEIRLKARLSAMISNGLEKGYYRIQAYKTKDINDDFLELLGFFQVFNMPYNIQDDERCKKMFSDIQFRQSFLLERLLNSDYLSDDVECLVRLLYEYMKFFVTMGIYPKEYIDNYIDMVGTVKSK